MTSVTDHTGAELFVSARVRLLRDIQMERLFAGYETALAGAPVPRDLAVGDVGVVIATEIAPEPAAMVEFHVAGAPLWRGALNPEEIERVDA
jgi:hypothetical protein